MPDGNFLLIVALVLVLAAEFVNGWTDAPNAIATVVSTRVLPPSLAVLMAAVLNVVGTLVTGTAVASTLGTGIVSPDVISGPQGLPVVIAATLTVVIWSIAAWFYGIPTSESHELIAGLTGAGLAVAGPSVLLWEGWKKVLIGLGFSTILGFSLGMIVMTSLYWILRRTSLSSIRNVFSRLQILSAAFMAFSHGSNDGQKFMGVFALALVLGLGTALGGWRIMRTVGFKITKLEPVNGFAAESSGAFAILLASRFGIPLSTTHCIGTAIMGVGATKRFSAVRWGIARNIVMAWIITFPVCAALGWVIASLLKLAS
jgi:PiT family inorganic phosphate transporter